MSISALTFDSSGRVISWLEGDYTYQLRRDGAGRPVFLRGQSQSRPPQLIEFRYAGVSSTFSGLTGDGSSSVMISHLVREAIERRVYATLTDLANDNPSNYAPGTTVYVGPDAYGQYAEWFSNGVRWRPRGGLLYTQNTPASLPDTTTTETDVWSFTIPNKLIGPNDVISSDWFWSYTNNATSKDFRIYFGGATWMTLSTASGAGFRGRSQAAMRNSKTVEFWPNALYGVAFAEGSTSSGGAQVSNVNTNNDVVVRAAARWAAGGGGANNITLERISLKIEYVA